MAIVNRDLDRTEQRVVLSTIVSTSVGASAGSAFHVAQAPFPCVLESVAVAANSVSGAPQVAVDIKRWSGAGVTTIPFVSTTLAITAHGISTAYQSVSLQSVGSTLTQLQAGDVVVLNQLFSGGNVAIGNAVVNVTIRALQDIKQHYNLPT